MQHLDEGTIHAWLDGALTPDEAARAEAHVKDCPQCQAAVAEARGFIAASSRILTALDNAPRGVIPAAAPARRIQPWVWRAAATVLVVATGTVLLVRERTPARNGELTGRLALPTKQAAAAGGAADSMSTASAELTQQTAPTAAPTAAAPPPTFSAAPQAAASRRVAARDQSARSAEGGARHDEAREEPASGARKELSAPVAAPAPVAQIGVLGGVSGALAELPRQLATKRTIGKTETFYEIAPGDTVVLEEQSSARLESVVVTGAATNRAAPMLRAGKAAAAAEPQQKIDAAAAPPPPPAVAALEDARNPEIHRISWLDRSSGRVLILSGRHSQEELQQIREKIQQLRDAAAQSKKLPE